MEGVPVHWIVATNRCMVLPWFCGRDHPTFWEEHPLLSSLPCELKDDGMASFNFISTWILRKIAALFILVILIEINFNLG
jgi:hypothetical protein